MIRKSFRPLYGVSTILLDMWMREKRLNNSFRPLYGVSTILPFRPGIPLLLAQPFSSPLRGFYNSTELLKLINDYKETVFVPSTGFLQFYDDETGEVTEEKILFSSPLRGFYNSTWSAARRGLHLGFRPLYGVSTILPEVDGNEKILCNVFVPSTGFLQFYLTMYLLLTAIIDSFRPLYGVSTILLSTERSVQRQLEDVFVPSTGFLQFYLF